MTQKTTDFGFNEVPIEKKEQLVKGVFDSVASQYDLMNDVMSLGIHRLWKTFTIDFAGLKPGQKVLDIAGGTGDLSRAFAKRVGAQGLVVLADINHSMLAVGRDKIRNKGLAQPIHFVQTNAQCLAFPDNYFDCVSISFGLRNVTDKEAALSSMFRVLKPGGQLLILEFSKPLFSPLGKLYDLYSFSLVPKLGKWLTEDEASYQYLVESIRKHPDQTTLEELVRSAGFVRTGYKNLSGGIVALHYGYKP